MFPRQDEQGDVPEWTRLGQYVGVELTFVRELLEDEGIALRERSLLAPDGALTGELCVTSLQHDRAAALVAAAQADAEAAAYRETAAQAAEHARATAEAATAAAIEARANAAATRRALRQEAHRAAKAAARHQKQGRPYAPHDEPRALEHSEADRAVRVIGAGLALLTTFFVVMTIVGERYGTHAPVPGRTGPPLVCHTTYRGSSCY